MLKSSKSLIFLIVFLLSLYIVNAEVMSISNVVIDGNGFDRITGKALIAEIRSSPISADDLIIKFDSTNIDNALPESVSVDNPVLLRLAEQRYGASYKFDKLPGAIYDVIYLKDANIGTVKLDVPAKMDLDCKEKAKTWLKNNNYILYVDSIVDVKLQWTTLYCSLYAFVGKSIQGYSAQVVFEQKEFYNRWQIESLTGTKYGDLQVYNEKTKGTQLSDWFGNSIFVKYTGSVNWFFIEPSANNVMAVYDKSSQNKWILVNEQAYNDYKNFINKLPDPYSIKDYTGVDYTTQEKQLYSKLITSKLPSDWTQTNIVKTSVNSLSESSGSANVELTGQVSVPTFKLIMSADYIKLRINAGIPDIRGVKNAKFTEGGTGICSIEAGNIGETRGTFTLSGTCDNNFEITHQDFQLDKKTYQWIDLYVTGKNSNFKDTVNGACNIILRENTQETTKTVKCNVKMDSLSSCTVGSQESWFDAPKNLWAIKQYTTTQCQFALTYCNAEETVKRNNEGKLVCAGKDDPNIPCPDILIAGLVPMPDILCLFQTWFNQYIRPFIWLVGGIISLFLGGITFFLLKSLTLKLGIKQDKTINIMLTIMSVLATVVYALIFVWQWWIGLILLILLIVLKIVI